MSYVSIVNPISYHVFQDNNKDLFTSNDGKNLLFTDTTKCLQEIKQSVDEFLTKAYIDMIERTYKTSQDRPGIKCAYNILQFLVENSRSKYILL